MFFVPAFVISLCAFVVGAGKFQWMPLIWLILITASLLLIAPVKGWGNLPVWIILALFPMAALSSGRFALGGCCAILALFAVVLLYQYFFDPSVMYHGKRASWPMINPNNAGTLMATTLVLAAGWFDRARRPLAALLVILFLAALLTTQSRGAVIGAAAGFGLYFYATRPRARLWATGGVFIAGAVMMTWERARQALMERFPIWEVTYPRIDLTGHGIGSFFRDYPKFRTETYTDGFFVHNDFLQFAYEMGVPIAAFFAIWMLWQILDINRRNAPYVAAFAVICVHSLVSFPFYLPPIAIFAGVLISRIAAKR